MSSNPPHRRPPPLPSRDGPGGVAHKDEYTVQWDFVAQNAGEITVAAGMTVVVLDRNNPDWWNASCHATGATGFIPPTYLSPVSAAHAAPAAPVAVVQK
ncbi:MAG: SH3 domain-containing protein, partial [archaeon]|nr:SH3 domain-containing protein [archaeon]